MSQFIIKFGQVESILDETHGGRIKCRLSQDKGLTTQELPYCFPLMPKTFQSVPKIGECALVICADASNVRSTRFYIGPVISQPQFFTQDNYLGGVGSATSLFPTGSLKPLESIDKYAETAGAFPEPREVAMVGRVSEDIILGDREINIRCGVRQDGTANGEPGLRGNVIFNNQDPAYIQLRHRNEGFNNSSGDGDISAKSVVNVVADKINLISHQDHNVNDKLTTAFKGSDVNSAPLINPYDQSDIMSKLHQIPYGDVLVEYLEYLRNMVMNHVHTFPLNPPCEGTYCYDKVNEFDLNTIKSPNVRTS